MAIKESFIRVVFRVDASALIGTGHFTRCLTLALELSRRGASVNFVFRQLPEYLQSILTQKKIKFNQIGSSNDPNASSDLPHAQWLSTTQEVDAFQTKQVIDHETWDWIIVDHYALDVVWEKAMRSLTKKIAVIDDIADRFHDCDVLLDQNYYENATKRYTELVPVDCQLLLGPKYALLRDEFRKLRKQVKNVSGRVQRVLVFFGGADKHNYTGRVVNAMSSHEFSALGVEVDVVVGQLHPQLQDIQLLCITNGFNCHVQTNQMADLMSKADLAIGAGGVALWERCCLAIPSFIMPTAQNQEKQVMDVASAGGIYAPMLKLENSEHILKHIIVLFENPALLRSLSKCAADFVDGYGLTRVADCLVGNLIRIKKATSDDSKNIFHWRNMPIVREVSLSRNIILWEEHQEWFCSTISSECRHLLIGELADTPVGVVRFEVDADVAEVSIYLTPEMHGRGLGGGLLKCAEEWLLSNIRGITKLKAVVLEDNVRSIKLFKHAGYVAEQTQFTKLVS